MKSYLGILLFSILAFSFQNKKEKIARMNSTSTNLEISEVIPHFIDFKDTIPNDTLLIYLTENKIPVKYSREITTGVCIDGECRLVKIKLFWDFTGRYLGFEIPEGEFLSKNEHDPFSPEEYDKLHRLLAEPNSPLANYSIDELVPSKKASENEVDAVSSATISAVLNHVVKGAVYTSYTLWHIVYGNTKQEIEKLSSEKLAPDLVLKLLESEKIKDKVWALNHFPAKMEISEELQKKLIEMISGHDIYLAERALNSIRPEVLTDAFQSNLMTVFLNSGFLQKRLILQKFKETPQLNRQVVSSLSQVLNSLNGTLIKSALELFSIQNIENESVSAQVALLLKSENRFVADQAFRYLDKIKVRDKKTLKTIEKYRRKNL